MPKISVFIASYNHARYLPQAIESVLAQTEKDFELLILDDGSTDESWAIIQDFARKDSRIVAWRQENQGVIATINTLAARVSGEYVAHLASDDVWQPHRLAWGLEDLTQQQDLVASFCSFLMIDQDGMLLPNQSFQIQSDLQGADLVAHLCVANCLGALTAFLRRSSLVSVGPFAREVPGVEDWDLWLRLAAIGPIKLRAGVGACYRLHGSNQSLSNLDTSYRHQLRLLSELSPGLMAKYRLGVTVLGRLHLRRSWLAAQLGEWRAAFDHLQKKRAIVGLTLGEFVELASYAKGCGLQRQADAIVKALRQHVPAPHASPGLTDGP